MHQKGDAVKKKESMERGKEKKEKVGKNIGKRR